MKPIRGDRVDLDGALGTVVRTNGPAVHVLWDDTKATTPIDARDMEPHPVADGCWYALTDDSEEG